MNVVDQNQKTSVVSSGRSQACGLPEVLGAWILEVTQGNSFRCEITILFWIPTLPSWTITSRRPGSGG